MLERRGSTISRRASLARRSTKFEETQPLTQTGRIAALLAQLAAPVQVPAAAPARAAQRGVLFAGSHARGRLWAQVRDEEGNLAEEIDAVCGTESDGAPLAGGRHGAARRASCGCARLLAVASGRT